MTISERFEYEEISGFRFGYAPIGRPRMVSHVYYVDGLLIDTGHPWVRKEVLHAVRGLPIDQQFITHYHEDHTGNLAALQQHLDCPAYAPPLTCSIMQDPPPTNLAQLYTWGTRPTFRHLRPKTGSLYTGKYRLDLIPIPGHAPDMVALHEPDRGWLFSADLYINSYISFFINDESMLDQIRSMQRVLKLDFDVMLCGHNPQFDKPKEALRKKLAFFEEFFGRVKELHAKGLTATEIFKAMKLKEATMIKLASYGTLSKMHMVRSAIRDIESTAIATS
ncbi:MAG: MBL fold metallo-hydrolase [Cyclobacteriaceae bacterium]